MGTAVFYSKSEFEEFSCQFSSMYPNVSVGGTPYKYYFLKTQNGNKTIRILMLRAKVVQKRKKSYQKCLMLNSKTFYILQVKPFYLVLFHPIPSLQVPSHPITSHHILSCPVPFRPIPSHSHPIPSHSFLSYHILNCPYLVPDLTLVW